MLSLPNFQLLKFRTFRFQILKFQICKLSDFQIKTFANDMSHSLYVILSAFQILKYENNMFQGRSHIFLYSLKYFGD